MSKLDLDTLWLDIKKGNELAFIDFEKELSPSLYRYILFLLDDDSVIAEEILQDILVKIWFDREKINIRGKIKPYLYKAAKNQTINYLNSKNTRKSSVYKLVSYKSWQFITETFICQDDIIEKLEANDTKELINKCVKELPDQCRQIFEMSRFHGLSNKEIAIKLKLSQNTIRTQLYRALVKIRSVLYS
jgi:RNA polymerase sigma-70 factor (ECF subfamily)